MNIQNTKKLTVALLAGVLMLGSAFGVSATGPVNTVESTVARKAIAIETVAVEEKDQEKQQLRLTRLDGKSTDAIEISVIPLASIASTTKAEPAGDQVSMKAIQLVPAKAVPMEKIVIE